MKHISVLLLFLFFSLYGSAQENKKNYDEAFKLIEVWLEAQKDFENIPGMVAIIVEDQEVLWTGAFGKSNLEQDKDMNANTICSICSITKSFTAVAVMRLIDEGKLSLDDKVKDILPFFEVDQTFPSGGEITVGSLLSHSSGLPGNTNHSYFSKPDFIFPSQEEFRAAFCEMETEFEVGTNVSYSNVGYALLGEIIEKVSGVPYETYIYQEILTPLNMSETYMGANAISDNNVQALGYTALNRNRARKSVNIFETKAMKPAMGLWTSVQGLAKYASWQFRLRDANNPEILKPSTLKKMHMQHAASKDGYLTWGLGFEVIKDANNDHWVSHGGTCPGFVSLLQLNLSSKIGIAILINGNRSYTFKYVNGIKQILAKLPAAKDKHNTKVNLNDYTGFYDMNPWNSEVYVSTWGEGLVVLQLPENSPKQGMMFYKHIRDDTFRYVRNNGELGGTIVFERDNSGEVDRYKEGGNYKLKVER